MQMLAVRHKGDVMKGIRSVHLIHNKLQSVLATIAVGGALHQSFIIIIRRKICAQMNSI